MDTPELSLALGKVLIAAAWADGVIQAQERSCLKDFLFKMPGIGEAEWRELEAYMATQIDENERICILQDFRKLVPTEAEKRFAIQAVQQIFIADGAVSPEEWDAIRQIVKMIQGADEEVMLEVSRVLRVPFQRRAERVSATLPQRQQIPPEEDLAKDKENLSGALEEFFLEAGIQLDADDATRNRLCLLGCFIGRMANADGHIDDCELAAMADTLKNRYSLSGEQIEYAVRIAVSEEAKQLDLLRITREFYEHNDEAERLKLLELLALVSMADGVIQEEEITELYRVAHSLKLSESRVQSVVASLPRATA